MAGKRAFVGLAQIAAVDPKWTWARETPRAFYAFWGENNSLAHADFIVAKLLNYANAAK